MNWDNNSNGIRKTEFKPKGIIPAVITPLTNDGKFNEKAMRKLLNYLIDGGVHGLFVVGTTGEFYGLTPEEKRDIYQVAMDEAKRKGTCLCRDKWYYYPGNSDADPDSRRDARWMQYPF
ncbi:MAG: dihydrodipicolinate synthase family protein [Bacillus subtilis]|nr:dihydrodipicolinate synthase family protein [Bacillus subtilis]